MFKNGTPEKEYEKAMKSGLWIYANTLLTVLTEPKNEPEKSESTEQMKVEE